MKIGKWLAIAAIAYVGLVVGFELYLGIGQPTMERLPIAMLVLTTTDESGTAHERRLARMDSGGRLYVSAHHWPRAWYRRALENPDVRVAFDDGTGGAYRAVPVDGEEFERVAAEFPIPLPIRFVMGFPPRDLLRLDPRGSARVHTDRSLPAPHRPSTASSMLGRAEPRGSGTTRSHSDRGHPFTERGS